jgi:hypothetical protein
MLQPNRADKRKRNVRKERHTKNTAKQINDLLTELACLDDSYSMQKLLSNLVERGRKNL